MTNVNGTNVTLTGKKVHDFSLTKFGKKRKIPSMGIETLIIRGQQNFDL